MATTAVAEELIAMFESGKTAHIYDALVKVKNDLGQNIGENAFLVGQLTKYLEHPVLGNICLNIIADGCLAENFVKYFLKYKGMCFLERVMDCSRIDDSLNAVCRTLGNVAKNTNTFQFRYFLILIPNILNYLSKTRNCESQLTVLQTLEILGTFSNITKLILLENGIECIGKFFHSANIQLQTYSLKALVRLTNNLTDLLPQCVSKGSIISVLVDLHSHPEESVRNYAFLSLINMSFVEGWCIDFFQQGAIRLLTKILHGCHSRETRIVTLLALSNCLDNYHAWKHFKTDAISTLKALLNLLRNKVFQDIHLHVIKSLCRLITRRNVTNILLNHNVLLILISILKQFIKQNKCISCRNCKLLKKYVAHSSTTNFTRSVGTSNNEGASEEASFCPNILWKRKSSTLINILRVSRRQRFIELFLSNAVYMDENEHENYAHPVVRKYMSFPKIDNKINRDFYTFPQLGVSLPERGIDKHIIEVFRKLLILKQGKHLICKEMCYSVLLDYMLLIKHPSYETEKCLLNAVEYRGFLTTLVKNGFVLEIHKRFKRSENLMFRCSLRTHCIDVLQNWVESCNYHCPSQVNSFFFYLLKSSEKSIQSLAMHVISTMITPTSSLQEIIFKRQGIGLLIQLLRDDSLRIRKNAVITLHNMYNNSSEFSSETETDSSYLGSVFRKPCFYVRSNRNISFIVDSHETISANRETICERSQYFRALLTGNFRERNENLISVREISAENLLTIFHFLHGCGEKSRCRYLNQLSVQRLLELLSYSEQFLILDFKNAVEHKLERYALCPYNIILVYEQSKIHNSPKLSSRALRSFLGSTFSEEEIFWTFNKLLSLDSRCDFLGDIERLLNTLLRFNMFFNRNV